MHNWVYTFFDDKTSPFVSRKTTVHSSVLVSHNTNGVTPQMPTVRLTNGTFNNSPTLTTTE